MAGLGKSRQVSASLGGGALSTQRPPRAPKRHPDSLTLNGDLLRCLGDGPLCGRVKSFLGLHLVARFYLEPLGESMQPV